MAYRADGIHHDLRDAQTGLSDRAWKTGAQSDELQRAVLCGGHVFFP